MNTDIFPAWFRIGLLALILAAFGFTAANSGTPALSTSSDAISQGELVEQLSLFFNDQTNGDINVVNAEQNQVIHRLTMGEGGFMRSVVRGLARERMANGFGPEEPFLLSIWDTGLVSLIDPVTDRVIALSAFGRDNVMAFTQLFAESQERS